MENFASLLHGFQIALTAHHVALMFAGVLLGILVGVLPGLGGANGVAHPVAADLLACRRLRRSSC
jgi:putative tricarboxylic transport membrane protein